MSEYTTYNAIVELINSGVDLAEHLKDKIRKATKENGGVAVIDDETVLALNRFRIAINDVADLPEQLESVLRKFN